MSRHRDLSQPKRRRRHPAPSYVVRTPQDYQFFDPAWFNQEHFDQLARAFADLGTAFTESIAPLVAMVSQFGEFIAQLPTPPPPQPQPLDLVLVRPRARRPPVDPE